MTIFNGLLIGAFLILLAASAAVVGSMIVLGLFELAFGKKRKAPIDQGRERDTDMVENVERSEPASNSKAQFGEQSHNIVVPFKRTA